MKRRQFLQLTAALAGVSPLWHACNKRHSIKGGIIGASSNIGHLLRNKTFDQPAQTEHRQVVIVGGGVSGLSAARWLNKNSIKDFVLLDLEDHVGGNASYGSNSISAYPWGAHYLPIPNNNLQLLASFLQEHGVITGYDNKGLPIYNEEHLCQAPEERLYINGHWQEGLVPHFGVPAHDQKQIEQFLQLMQQFRVAKGKDGKEAFAVPVNTSSKDETFTSLDNITMKAWLQQQQFNSSYLHWYVNYCTRDDFGTPYDQISAWAGIHYFAARKGQSANAEHQDVLTWPEGNGWLVQRLQTGLQQHLHTNALAVKVFTTAAGVQINYFDTTAQTLNAYTADHCIMATPQFVNSRLLNDTHRTTRIQQHLHYAPWMVANLCLQKPEERSGTPMCWDNVIYDSDSLGYVEATHQLLQQHTDKINITYYRPLAHTNTVQDRKQAMQTTYGQWQQLILQDLRKVHPDIDSKTESLDVMLWGHAMAQPLPGLIHGTARAQLQQSIDHRIHFAHTDLAGISIFEEAFYQGIYAASNITGPLKQPL